MSTLNKIIVIGNLTSEPEQKTTNAGDAFARFSLAVDRPAATEGAQSGTDFLTVVAWRDLAQRTVDLHKGDLTMVEGRIITRTYDDEEGKRHYITEIEARDVKPLIGGHKQVLDTADMVDVATASSAPVADMSEGIAPSSASSIEMKPVTAVTEDAFDFSESPSGSLDVPASFGEEVEEDIPF